MRRDLIVGWLDRNGHIEVRYRRSPAGNLIQATDMLSGAIYTRYHRSNSELFDSIRVKISDLWEWRPRTQ